VSDTARSDLPTRAWQPAGFPPLLDRYQVLGVLGEGGMGTVYKAYHLSLKRFFAIKVLRLDGARHPDLVVRFLREMESVGQMDHPNVVRATDAGQKNGIFYLVMEYLTGANLSRLVAQRGPLGPADACELARQAALGLDYAHRTLVHRDVKPSNLMLTPAGLVKVLDLGLARLHEADVGERTPEGFALGTYDYVAPEQAVGSGRIDGRADVYGLGCTLFKLLTGRAPFEGPEYDTPARKLYAHGHVPLSAVPGLAAVPESVRPVLLRMTAKAPEERFASAGEVAQALAPLAAGAEPLRLLDGNASEPPLAPLPQPAPAELSRLTDVPHETPPAPRAPPTATPPRRRAWPWALLGAGLLACALVAAAWFVAPGLFERNRPAPNEPPEAAPTLRSLDELPANTFHPLLERRPVVIGCDWDDRRKWQWDRGRQEVEVKGAYPLLFPVGTTARPRFTLQACIAQAPWTGNVGVFWGYREDAAARAARTPEKEFAWFQMLLLQHTVGGRGEDRYAVERGKGALWYTAGGELRVKGHASFRQEVPLLSGPAVALAFSVDHGRVSRAALGPVELTNLCSAQANAAVKSEPYQGAVGLVTIAHRVTFDNVRFIAE
jgi:hypothetical protein